MALRQQGKIAEAQILEQQAMAAYQAAVEKEFLQAQLEQQANISNAGFDLQGQSLGLQGQALGLQSNQAHMSNLMNLFGVAGGFQNEQRQGATGPLGLIGQYASTILPMLAQFGQQTSSRTGTSSGSNMQPGMGISPIGSMLAGLGGGAAQGYGLQNLIGGSKGGGGPNIMDSLSNTYGLWYQPQLGNYSGTGGR